MKAYPLIGESSGIMGKNRSGKSTLSEMVARVIYRDSRSVVIKGGVASFTRLGAGAPAEGCGVQCPAGQCDPRNEEV
jgi:ABC-type polysaccharide/polyol phosphate transport system ATPase subunit